MKAYLIQIDGWSGSTAVPVRLASHDDDRLCHLDGQVWWPAIATLPTLRYDFFDGAFDAGSITSPTGSFTAAIGAIPNLPALALHDARVRIWRGELGEAWATFTLISDGRVKEQPSVADGVATFNMGTDDSWLDQPLLSTYAGTGGSEGSTDLQGQVKPLALGAPRFAPAVLVDAVDNIYQISAYGAINAVPLAFDRLTRFGAAQANYASFATLKAATVTRGRWATSLAGGYVKLGAPADGMLSFHVEGDAVGGWSRLPGAIIARIAAIAGGTAKVAAGDITALNAARPWNLSLMVTAQTTARDLIQRIAASVNAVAYVDWLGMLRVAPIGIGAAALTMAADGSALPPVASVEQVAIGTPYWKVAQGAAVTWQVHGLGDIAFNAPLNPRGPYYHGESYREGDMVTLPNGSQWLYVGTVPTTASSPSDSNPNWFRLSDDITADNISYVDGTPMEDLKPAEPNATNGATPEQVGQITDLETATAQALSAIAAAEATITTMQADAAQVQADLSAAEAGIVAQGALISALGADIAAITVDVGALADEITAAGGEIDTIQTTVGQHGASITTLQTTVSNHTGTLATHTSQISTANANISNNATAITTANTNIANLTVRVGSAESSITSSATAITNLTGRTATLETTVSAQGASITTLQTTASNHTGQIATINTTLTTQGASITTNSIAISTLQGSVATLTTQVTASNPNLLPNSSGEAGWLGWSPTTGWTIVNDSGASGVGTYFLLGGTETGVHWMLSDPIARAPGTYTVSYETNSSGAGTSTLVDVQCYDAGGVNIYNAPESSAGPGQGWTDRAGRSITFTAPAGTATIRVRLYGVKADASDRLRIRRIKLEAGLTWTPYSNEASVIQSFTAISTLDGQYAALSTTVSAQGASITSLQSASSTQAGQIATLTTNLNTANANISTNASAISGLNSSVASISSTLSTQGASITANGSAITTLQGNVATLTTRVAAGGDNLLLNGGFENMLTGWAASGGGPGSWSIRTNYLGRWAWQNGSFSGFSWIYSDFITVTAGVAYTATADSRIAGAGVSSGDYARIDILWYDSSNVEIGKIEGPRRYGSHNFTTDGSGRSALSVTDTPPTGTTKARARLLFWVSNTTGFDGGWQRAKFERGSVATAYTNESAVQQSFSALSTLTTQYASLSSTVSTQGVTITTQQTAITTINGNITTLFGRWGFEIDVNGYVSGMVQNNNGARADTTFRSDRFRVLPPGGSGDGFYIDIDGSNRTTQYILSSGVRVVELGWLS